MALKLNINRTYKHPVTVRFYNEDGKIQTGTFVGEFAVLKTEDYQKDGARLIDVILKGVEGLELADEHGNQLTGSELLDAVKNDTDLANACVEAYNESTEKKRAKPKTSEAL
jgi:hypothetical protein